MHTFGDGYANYFYGRNPRQMSLSGLLIDDIDNDWFYKFMMAYDKFLRGTSLAKNYRLIQLTLPNVVLVGTILDLQYSHDSSNDAHINFSMNFLIKEMSYISSKATKETKGANNIFANKLTVRDYATLTKAEIDRRNIVRIDESTYSLGYRQDIVQMLASEDTFSVMPNEQAQSLYKAFSNNQSLGQLTKIYTKTKDAALAALAPVMKFIKTVTDGLEDVTNFFRNITAQIYALTQFFSGIPNAIASFTQKLLAPLKALLDIPTALRSLVYSVKLIKDSVVQSLGNIKNTFKEVIQVFTNARATLMSAPDSFAAKLSAGSAKGEFASVASLGSFTAGVVDSEAISVLQLLNKRDAESFSTLQSSENEVNSFEFSSVITL